MAKARLVKQLNFTLPDRRGLLSEITSKLSNAKVNITSICAYNQDDKAYFMLTTESNAKAKRALSDIITDLKEEEVVSVEMPNRAGELEKVAKRISEAGININYVYGTAGGVKSAICILKTEDNKKTVRLINKK